MSFYKQLTYKYKVYNADPTTLIGIILAIAFAYLIAAPIVLLLSDAMIVQFADRARSGQQIGEVTFYYLNRAFFSAISTDVFWRPLWEHSNHRTWFDCLCACHGHSAGMAFEPHKLTGQEVVLDSIDRSLHAAVVDLRVGLADAV